MSELVLEFKKGNDGFDFLIPSPLLLFLFLWLFHVMAEPALLC